MSGEIHGDQLLSFKEFCAFMMTLLQSVFERVGARYARVLVTILLDSSFLVAGPAHCMRLRHSEFDGIIFDGAV